MGRCMRVVAICVVVLACAETGFAAVTMEPLCIRIYDTAGTSPDDRRRAMKRATEILADADVEVDWRDCSPWPAPRHPSCSESPKPGELVVRLVRQPESRHLRALGEALVDTATRTGVLATVFVDRIEQFAARARADVESMLGRVVAHEIGHLLLGTPDHAQTGLMREIWSAKDPARKHGDDWLFSRADIERIRQFRRTS